MNAKIVTLGEILLRLSTPGFERMVQAGDFEVNYGGAEANVAAALCNYGLPASFVSKVPEHAIGQAAINQLRRFGVNTDFIVRGGERLGVYFLESGSWARPSKVIYDRTHSAISEADISEFDFDKIFEGVSWFHTTGITPAISDKAAAITGAALQAARKKGITTSFDMNYRQKLWNKDKARAVLGRLMKYVDVYIGNVGHSELLLHKEPELEGYEEVCTELKEKFGFKYIACTLRDSYSASINDWSGLIYDGSDLYKTREYKVEIVDRVGSGDAFAAGLIYGMLMEMSSGDAAEFGVAAAALKHTIPGDFNHVTVEEVMQLLNGEGSGKVER